MTMNAVVMLVACAFLVACDDGGGIKERASIEGAAGIEAENENLRRRAEEMEADLKRRQGFHQGIAATYEGMIRTDQGDLKMRVTLVPSLSPVVGGRTRLPEEIAQDLASLSLSAQLQQWSPEQPLATAGCRVQGLKPSLTEGLLQVASENCNGFYDLWIADSSVTLEMLLQRRSDVREVSRAIAQDMIEGRMEKVDRIVGVLRPTSNASVFHFQLDRVQR
jgi:hypothetical protein